MYKRQIEEQPAPSVNLRFDKDYGQTILQTLRRRPCTVQDLSRIVGLHPAEVQKYLRKLLSAGHIEMERRKRGTFVKIKGS